MQFLAIGSDLRMMTVKAQETLRDLQPAKATTEVAKY
jgi:hypothetical protein